MTTAIVEEVFIDFVGEYEQIMANSKFGDPLYFGLAKNFAGRIGWCVDDDTLGLGGHRRFPVFWGKGPIGCAHSDINRDCFGRQQGVYVVAVVGFKEDDLVSRVQKRETCAI